MSLPNFVTKTKNEVFATDFYACTHTYNTISIVQSRADDAKIEIKKEKTKKKKKKQINVDSLCAHEKHPQNWLWWVGPMVLPVVGLSILGFSQIYKFLLLLRSFVFRPFTFENFIRDKRERIVRCEDTWIDERLIYIYATMERGSRLQKYQ